MLKNIKLKVPLKGRQKKNMFEDGDLFYMDEFSNEDVMFAKMIKEIEDGY